ncbi:MAG: DUF177 domain-containing protein [Bacteroidales bacterium]|nr:DUF177 domain-containing protein [Bacteroidales bacterium]
MQPFVISVKGLKPGRSHLDWHADGSFFASYDNSEVKDADLDISVDIDNGEFEVVVNCVIEGTVTVLCDRCLEDLTLPVSTSFEEDETLDLNQDIYDYVCISLPMQRVHPDGGCNEETLKYLSK